MSLLQPIIHNALPWLHGCKERLPQTGAHRVPCGEKPGGARPRRDSLLTNAI